MQGVKQMKGQTGKILPQTDTSEIDASSEHANQDNGTII